MSEIHIQPGTRICRLRQVRDWARAQSAKHTGSSILHVAIPETKENAEAGLAACPHFGYRAGIIVSLRRDTAPDKLERHPGPGYSATDRCVPAIAA